MLIRDSMDVPLFLQKIQNSSDIMSVFARSVTQLALVNAFTTIEPEKHFLLLRCKMETFLLKGSTESQFQ